MSRMKTIFLASFGLGIAAPAVAQPPAHAPAPAPAPAAAPISVGMAVKDSSGGDVGTVTKVDGQFLVVKTDKHEVRLPVTSFTPHNGALLFGMTRDQLNAETERTLAAAAAKIAVGAAVSDGSGGAVGTITAVDPQSVTLKLTTGTEVRLPRAAVGAGANGVVVGSTAAQLEAAAKAAAPATPAPAPAATTPPHGR